MEINSDELNESLEKYMKDKAAGKIKYPTCEECGGGTNHLFRPHKDTCSQFQHMVDDHYDSACMRGTCKYCNPDYKPKTTTQVTEEELQMLEDYRKKL